MVLETFKFTWFPHGDVICDVDQLWIVAVQWISRGSQELFFFATYGGLPSQGYSW